MEQLVLAYNLNNFPSANSNRRQNSVAPMSALFVTRITYLLYVCYSSPTQMHEITVQSVVCYYCPSAVPVLSYYSNVRRKFYSIKRVSLFWALGIGGIGGSLYTGSLQLETGFLLSIAFNFLVSLIQSSLVSLS